MGGECKFHTQWEQIHISKSILLHILLFFPGIPGLGAVRSVCCWWDGVSWWALLAGRIGGMGGMRKTGPGLASVVVELHQTEDQVCRHKLKLIRWVCDNITAKKEGRMFRFQPKISSRDGHPMNIYKDFCYLNVYMITVHIIPHFFQCHLMSDITLKVCLVEQICWLSRMFSKEATSWFFWEHSIQLILLSLAALECTASSKLIQKTIYLPEMTLKAGFYLNII